MVAFRPILSCPPVPELNSHKSIKTPRYLETRTPGYLLLQSINCCISKSHVLRAYLRIKWDSTHVNSCSHVPWANCCRREIIVAFKSAFSRLPNPKLHRIPPYPTHTTTYIEPSAVVEDWLLRSSGPVLEHLTQDWVKFHLTISLNNRNHIPSVFCCLIILVSSCRAAILELKEILSCVPVPVSVQMLPRSTPGNHVPSAFCCRRASFSAFRSALSCVPISRLNHGLFHPVPVAAYPGLSAAAKIQFLRQGQPWLALLSQSQVKSHFAQYTGPHTYLELRVRLVSRSLFLNYLDPPGNYHVLHCTCSTHHISPGS